MVDAGFAKTRAIDPTFFFTARSRWYFNNYLGIEPDIGFWKSDHADHECIGTTCKDLALRDLDTSVSLIVNDPAWDSTSLYFGGGVGAHFRKGDISVFEERTETRFGVQFLFGVQHHFND